MQFLETKIETEGDEVTHYKDEKFTNGYGVLPALRARDESIDLWSSNGGAEKQSPNSKTRKLACRYVVHVFCMALLSAPDYQINISGV